MHERLINFGAWRRKNQLYRLEGTRCAVCSHVSLEGKVCTHTHPDSVQPKASVPAKRAEEETHDQPELEPA